MCDGESGDESESRFDALLQDPMGYVDDINQTEYIIADSSNEQLAQTVAIECTSIAARMLSTTNIYLSNTHSIRVSARPSAAIQRTMT